ncbi:MAG: flavin reductase family protein [Mobilicoccus sp.]|nr:flavin reductase family protein [Mobilicoccus sp.]
MMREIDMAELGADPVAPYRLLNSVVVPRPIALVSTRSIDGVDNVAPHSFFTVASAVPPIVAFTSIGTKDTLRNIRAGSDFVVHVVDEDMMTAVNRAGAGQPPHVSEFDDAGLTRAPSTVVTAARVAESPVALECRLERIVDFDDSAMILGRVVHAALRETLLSHERHALHPVYAELRPVARLGLDQWALPAETVSMPRPSWGEGGVGIG